MFLHEKVSQKNLGFNATTFFEKMKIYFYCKINTLSKIDNRRLGVAKKPRFFGDTFSCKNTIKSNNYNQYKIIKKSTCFTYTIMASRKNRQFGDFFITQ